MTLSLYDISVPTYQQMLGSVRGILSKGAAYSSESGVSLTEMANARLHPTMKPLRSQIVYVTAFPIMVLESLKTGEFIRTNVIPDDIDYVQMQKLVDAAIAKLDAINPEDINALKDNEVMIVKLPDIDTPFAAAEFILSFGHPNVHFHASTVYDILRMMGVPLEKRDILGAFRVKQSTEYEKKSALFLKADHQ